MALRFLLSSSPPLSPISGRRPSFSTSPALTGTHFPQGVPVTPTNTHYAHRSCTLNPSLTTLIRDALPSTHPAWPSPSSSAAAGNNLGLDLGGSNFAGVAGGGPPGLASAHANGASAQAQPSTKSRSHSNLDSQAGLPNISPRSVPSMHDSARGVPGPISLPGSMKLARSSSFPTTQALAALGANILTNLRSYVQALYQAPPASSTDGTSAGSVPSIGELVRSASRASVRSSSSATPRIPSVGLIIGGALTTYLQLSNLDEDIIIYLLMDPVEVDCKQITFIQAPHHKRSTSMASLDPMSAQHGADHSSTPVSAGSTHATNPAGPGSLADEDEAEWDTEMLFEALYKRNFADASQLFDPTAVITVTPPPQRKPSIRK